MGAQNVRYKTSDPEEFPEIYSINSGRGFFITLFYEYDSQIL
jgi:hypothetical protein